MSDTTNAMVEHFHKGMILGMIQRDIFCPQSGRVLDIRTVKVIRDSDGDPAGVLSPEGYDMLMGKPELVAYLKSKGAQFPDDKPAE